MLRSSNPSYEVTTLWPSRLGQSQLDNSGEGAPWAHCTTAHWWSCCDLECCKSITSYKSIHYMQTCSRSCQNQKWPVSGLPHPCGGCQQSLAPAQAANIRTLVFVRMLTCPQTQGKHWPQLCTGPRGSSGQLSSSVMGFWPGSGRLLAGVAWQGLGVGALGKPWGSRPAPHISFCLSSLPWHSWLSFWLGLTLGPCLQPSQSSCGKNVANLVDRESSLFDIWSPLISGQSPHPPFLMSKPLACLWKESCTDKMVLKQTVSLARITLPLISLHKWFSIHQPPHLLDVSKSQAISAVFRFGPDLSQLW